MRRVELALPAWPQALDGLRVGVIGDLHAGMPHASVAAVARTARVLAEEAPDLVCLVGDFVATGSWLTRRVEPSDLAAALEVLRPPLGVLAVLGNHDWNVSGERIWRALADSGVEMLENAAREVAPGLWVAGVADLRRRRPDVPRALEDVPPDAAVLMLSHDPTSSRACPRAWR